MPAQRYIICTKSVQGLKLSTCCERELQGCFHGRLLPQVIESMIAAVMWKPSAGLMHGHVEFEFHSVVEGANSMLLERICCRDPFQLIVRAEPAPGCQPGVRHGNSQLLMPETLDALNFAEASLTQQPCL